MPLMDENWTNDSSGRICSYLPPYLVRRVLNEGQMLMRANEDRKIDKLWKSKLYLTSLFSPSFVFQSKFTFFEVHLFENNSLHAYNSEEAVIGNNKHSKIHILSRIIKIAQLYINSFFSVVNF